MPAPLAQALEQLQQVILGKERPLRLALCCLLARGHLLIEDIPGVGKTTLAGALAKVLGLRLRRVQFTSDLLPADIVGNSIFDREGNRFVFHEGPIFAEVVLADEVNRASPKTQSALLEAMEERQVTVDGQTHPLPDPFFVIATQNPTQQIGTFPLPESQLDRFLMRVQMGFPDRHAELAMLAGGDRRALVAAMAPALDATGLVSMQRQLDAMAVRPALREYILDLVARSRVARGAAGLSPRAALGLQQAAKAWAYLAGRDHVLPDDVQAVAPAVMAHRLRGSERGADGLALAESLVRETPIP
jgi:MoxR-like ATPase